MHVSRRPLFSLFITTLSYTVTASPIAIPLNVVQETDTDNPAPKSPKSSKDFITIFTDADVTWCRPWPNTAVHHQNSAHFYRGTPLNLTCWAPNDIPETDNGPGLSEPIDIWVKTGDMGCYINENDLRSANINFEDTLNLCRATGPRPLSGNRPENTSSTPIPLAVPSPVAPLIPISSPAPVALSNPEPAILPSPSTPKPPTNDNAPPVFPNPSAVSPNPAPVVPPSPSTPKPPMNDNAPPVFPNPSAVLPNPAPLPTPSTAKPPVNDNAPPNFPNPSLVPSGSPKPKLLETQVAAPALPKPVDETRWPEGPLPQSAANEMKDVVFKRKLAMRAVMDKL